MTKAPYSWVKRASQADKREMEDCVASLNELAHESYDTSGFTLAYKLERCGDCWGVSAYVARIHPDAKGQVQIGQKFGGSGSFVRCASCGHIRDLWDGQIEFCTDCGKDW